jgi:uncharacterized protein YggE
MNDSAPEGTQDQDADPSIEAPHQRPRSDRVRKRQLGPITFGRAIAVTAAASLLVGLVAGPILSNHPALAADPSATQEHTVTVSGTGEISVAPDVADVVLGVMAQKPTAAEAQSAAATSMTAVVAAVKKSGVADKDIVTINLNLSPVYDYGSGGSAPRLTGYQYANTVKVIVRNINSVASVVDGAVAAGATTVSGISFRLDDPKAVQAQVRQLAMNDARTKADALASAAGVSVKGVATIAEVAVQPNPVYYSGALDQAKAASVSTPIQTGTTDIVVQVTVSYLIG